MRRSLPWIAFLALAACQQGPPPPPPTGSVTPTVAGGADASFATAEAARSAFTRSCGSVTAVLEDASWIRYECAPSEAEKRHRAYFEYGYTTFDVTLRSRHFTQPTAEEFILEDSQGARLSGHPLSYQGAMKLENNEWWTNQFTVSFPHVLTSEVRWIRLTRTSDGSKVQWDFPAGGASAAAPCAPPAAPPAGPPPPPPPTVR
jgi:hypothetical protein